jgi:hypothetical protein
VPIVEGFLGPRFAINQRLFILTLDHVINLIVGEALSPVVGLLTGTRPEPPPPLVSLGHLFNEKAVLVIYEPLGYFIVVGVVVVPKDEISPQAFVIAETVNEDISTFPMKMLSTTLAFGIRAIRQMLLGSSWLVGCGHGVSRRLFLESELTAALLPLTCQSREVRHANGSPPGSLSQAGPPPSTGGFERVGGLPSSSIRPRRRDL